MASVSAQVEDSLSCSVCAEKYDNHIHVPKILPCQHTFCGACMNDIMDMAYYCTAKCPVCRTAIPSQSHVRTNLAVRDIAEAIAKQKRTQPAKQTSKLFCPIHPHDECAMFCTNCCIPLCALCVKRLAKGSHKGHDVGTMEYGTVRMKERFTKLIHEQTKNLKQKSDTLKKNVNEYEKEVESIMSMVSGAVEGWGDDLLQDQTRIMEEAVVCDQQVATWNEKLKLSDLGEILKVYREANSDKTLDSGEKPTNKHLNTDSIQQLRKKLLFVCDTIEASLDQHTSPVVSKPPSNVPNQMGEHVARVGLVIATPVTPPPSASPPQRFFSFQLREVRGDVFSAPSHFSLVCRISADLQMNDGCTAQFYQRFGTLHYIRKYLIKVGKVVFKKIKRGRYVYYLINKQFHSDFATLGVMRSCLVRLRDHCTQHGVKHLAMPKIGCGGDQLLWPDVKRAIEEVFSNTSFEIVVYEI